jgi:hypothetical protein
MSPMNPLQPPSFLDIADESTRGAFIRGYPEVVHWLPPGTKLFKWTKSVATSRGISPWWQFIEPVRLATGSTVPGIQDLQTRAARLGVSDRDFARTLVAVTEEWNKMTNVVGITLLRGAWGYIGKASGQRKNQDSPDVYFIGGEYQVWIPGLIAQDIARMRLLPYLKPNTPFGARW